MSLTHYPSWPSPRSHRSATGPRSQQTTFRAKTHQQAQRELARLAACAAPVRPATPVRPVDSAGQAGGYSSRTTSVPESLSDFSRPWNKKHPQNTTCKDGKPYTKPNKTTPNRPRIDQQHQDPMHTSQEVHPRKIPQVARTGQTGQEHRSDWCNLGSSG
jgi:hypothetical protein